MEDRDCKYILDEILKMTDDGFLIVDKNGIIIEMNEQYCRFIKKRIMMRGTHFCCSIRQRLWIMRKWTIKISVQSVILQYPAGNGTAVQGR